jgi:multidrug resistance efflux pump
MGIHLKSTRLIAWIKAHIRLSILAGLAMIYIGYELLSAIFVYSRDAYITTDLIGLAPEVSARVQTVLVRDNQSVRQGDVLIRLNPEVFELEVRRLKASLELARANVAKTKEAVDAAADQLAAKQATFDDAKANNERATELRTAGNLSQQAFDEAHSAYLVALANLAMARTAQVTARREIAVQTAAVAEMQAAVDRAQYDSLCSTVISRQPASAVCSDFWAVSPEEHSASWQSGSGLNRFSYGRSPLGAEYSYSLNFIIAPPSGPTSALRAASHLSWL